jgi:hypothetical protein
VLTVRRELHLSTVYLCFEYQMFKQTIPSNVSIMFWNVNGLTNVFYNFQKMKAVLT